MGLRLAGEQCADLGDDLPLLREFACRLLRVDIPAIDPDLEDATGTGDEADATQPVLVVVRDFLRQTGGLGQVASTGAVLDLELHDTLPGLPTAPMRPTPPLADLGSIFAGSMPANDTPGR